MDTVRERPALWRCWLKAARVPTLPAALVPVALGSALAAEAGVFTGPAALLCAVFAVLIQVGTNFVNDYADSQRGADTPERRGPARMVASGWIPLHVMRGAAFAAFGLALLVGCGLIPYGGWGLIGVGVFCVACGYAYTAGPYPFAYHGLGEVFVLVCFGGVATLYTFYVQAGGWEVPLEDGSMFRGWLWGGLLALVPGALANTLLLVNNLRDAEGDAAAGKRTLVVRLGQRWGQGAFIACHVVALGVTWVLAGSGFGYGALAPWLLGFLAWLMVDRLRVAEMTSSWAWLLQMSGLYLLSFGLLLSLGLVLS